MVQWNRGRDGSLEASDPAGSIYKITDTDGAVAVERYTGYGSATEVLWSGTILAKAMLYVFDTVAAGASADLRRAA